MRRQKQLLRALLNVRPPRDASPEFLQVQDEYLRAELAQKGVTVLESLTPAARCGEAALYLWQGDITTLQCDAIVNAANIASMKDGAILLNLARGPLLDEAAVAEPSHPESLAGSARTWCPWSPSRRTIRCWPAPIPADSAYRLGHPYRPAEHHPDHRREHRRVDGGPAQKCGEQGPI